MNKPRLSLLAYGIGVLVVVSLLLVHSSQAQPIPTDLAVTVKVSTFGLLRNQDENGVGNGSISLVSNGMYESHNLGMVDEVFYRSLVAINDGIQFDASVFGVGQTVTYIPEPTPQDFPPPLLGLHDMLNIQLK